MKQCVFRSQYFWIFWCQFSNIYMKTNILQIQESNCPPRGLQCLMLGTQTDLRHTLPSTELFPLHNFQKWDCRFRWAYSFKTGDVRWGSTKGLSGQLVLQVKVSSNTRLDQRSVRLKEHAMWVIPYKSTEKNITISFLDFWPKKSKVFDILVIKKTFLKTKFWFFFDHF